jgi:PKD repeat protein
MLRMPKFRSRARTRGQGVVELAIVLPILILLLLITLDFGRLFMSYITLTNTTRVAANYGATNPGNFTGTPNLTTYNAIVNGEKAGLNCDLHASGGFNPPLPTFPTGTGLSGKSVAEMTCDFTLLTPFMTQFFGGPLAISAKSEFPIRTGAIANIGGSTTLPPPGSPFAVFDFINVSGGTVDGSGNVSGVGSVTVNVDNKSVNAQTWEWDWGDGTPLETDPVPATHTFTPGTWTVKLTVRNPVGTSITTHTVTVTTVVGGPPVAGFYGVPVPNPPKFTDGGGSAGAPIRGSLQLVVNFTNTTAGGTAYSWDFGDGTPLSTLANPPHIFTTLGVFTVTLTVTAPTGAPPVTRTAYVTTGCVVPNFANTMTDAAEGTYQAAGFPKNSISYGGKSQPPKTNSLILTQSIPGGSFIAATQQGSNWVCKADINLTYQP